MGFPWMEVTAQRNSQSKREERYYEGRGLKKIGVRS